ncbi:Arc family DNA-binding protein [Ewingella americana]|jgi:hypothetical protein|uniref:Arc family DNA-binding protein n=1 Tax=Ewingella americana TaxID=41202 RepID=A0A502GKZ4_9GAMM|nr:Arc family DNA-binding protein [Ewingella americana]TPG62481.1 Arc family DNA-binding protein [Ewingella americana]
MSEISTLTIKIPVELKEQIRAAAAEAEHSLSVEVCARLEESFSHKEKKSAKASEHDIDNQHTSENAEPALTQKELKKLRTLLVSVRKTISKKK